MSHTKKIIIVKHDNCTNRQKGAITLPSSNSTTQVTNAEVVIYDMVGKEMMRKKLTGDRMEIDKGSLESGVYFVRVVSEERQWVEKIVVE